MPFASALFACDQSWWDKNLDCWENFSGMKFTWSKDAARIHGLKFAPGRRCEGLGTEILHAGGSSGYMAVNLAYFLGAAEIYLLGFDMKYQGDKSHWHGDHKNTSNPSPDMLNKWALTFVPMWEDLQKLGIPLVNCTRDTAMTIPQADLDEVLNGYR